jgi:hypothetical protein
MFKKLTVQVEMVHMSNLNAGINDPEYNRGLSNIDRIVIHRGYEANMFHACIIQAVRTLDVCIRNFLLHDPLDNDTKHFQLCFQPPCQPYRLS